MDRQLHLLRIWFYLALIFGISFGQKVVDLSGDGWTVQNLPLNISVPASLPSQAHLDLFEAQVIGDPYYGLNDFSLRWVAWANWTYVSDPVQGLSSSNNGSRTYLVFDGLDTFATISFCGQQIASTDNQFRQYVFDVTAVLCNCTSPVIELNFGSAPLITQAIANSSGQETWPDGVEQVYEFSNRQFMRKEQSDFGWDWGPAFAPAGPWQPAYVVQIAPQEAYVRNSDFDLYRQSQVNNLPPDQAQPWVLNASVDVIGTISSGSQLSYAVLDFDSNQTVSSGMLENVTNGGNVISGTKVLDDYDYELWWPNGMGSQKLYNVTVSVVSGNSSVATVNKRMGFRTVVLNENPISELQLSQGIANGTNWHFEINGHEFYAKGSNFIPPDAFWPRVDQNRIRTLFQMAVDGNQNMLRVWASGAYGPDFMYDIADELGLLLWSEFEFGDALYPVDDAFLANVAEEATYQVRRLNHHASLALWAGGNELESLELQLVNQSAPEQLGRYTGEYEKLFLNVLLPAVFGNSKSISYMPSSTNNGWLDLNFSNPIPIVERYQNLTSGYIYGDTDFYNYDSAVVFNDSEYPIGRFANEFGYHSYPSLQTWQQVLPKNQLYFNSSTVLSRNHHNPPGNLDIFNKTNSELGAGQITMAVQRYYPTPNISDSVANFSAWCQTTQIFQSELYRSEIQFYRRGSGFYNRQLGSLYWQLEDIWQAPTWAGIEYDGRWKYLHYGAKDIYEPVIISPFYNYTTGTFEVYVTSDLWTTVNGQASLTWYSWDGKPLQQGPSNAVPASSSAITFTVGAINTTLVYSANLLSSGLNLTNSVLFMNITATGMPPNSNASTTYKHDNFFHPVPLNQAALVDPGIQMSYNDTTKNFTVQATSGIASWTWLDYPAGAVVTFDSNAFTLIPGDPREVGYTVRSDDSNGAWVNGVSVRSIWNNTLS